MRYSARLMWGGLAIAVIGAVLMGLFPVLPWYFPAVGAVFFFKGIGLIYFGIKEKNKELAGKISSEEV